MLAYLIIAIELAILYGVFWYVFVREPAPRVIRRGDWGTYGDDSIWLTTFSAIPTHQYSTSRNRREYCFGSCTFEYDSKKTDSHMDSLHMQYHALLDGHDNSSVRSYRYKQSYKTKPSKHGWVALEETYKGKSIISKLLSYLGRTFSQLSVKIP